MGTPRTYLRTRFRVAPASETNVELRSWFPSLRFHANLLENLKLTRFQVSEMVGSLHRDQRWEARMLPQLRWLQRHQRWASLYLFLCISC